MLLCSESRTLLKLRGFRSWGLLTHLEEDVNCWKDELDLSKSKSIGLGEIQGEMRTQLLGVLSKARSHVRVDMLHQ